MAIIVKVMAIQPELKLLLVKVSKFEYLLLIIMKWEFTNNKFLLTKVCVRTKLASNKLIC